jgi:UPF0176 protein
MPDPTAPAFIHSAFYRFVPLPDAPAAAAELRALGADLGLNGAIVVAAEGLNGAVSGAPPAVEAFEEALRSGAVLEGAARGLAFKRSPCARDPFGRYKVVVKPEIVALGLPGSDTLPQPDERDDSHVSPAAWRELIARDDVVVLDNRNHFEWRLGRFKGAVDPQVRHFRDFVAYVQAQATHWRAEGRTVAMYCTGGIRCDKTAPWMRSLGLQVKQLDGGILNHFAALPDAERDWEGECFVFDKRVAVDTTLHETSTRLEAVFDTEDPGERWRLERARRLDAF